PTAGAERRHWRLHGLCRSLHQLLRGWRHGRSHRHAADAGVPDGIPVRAQARTHRRPAALARSRGGAATMTAIWDFFALPLSFPFMQRALFVALLVGAVSAVLSCYL